MKENLQFKLEESKKDSYASLWDKPKVIVYGLVNSGKSSLLNAILNEKKFPIGDALTTKKVRIHETEQIYLIDTPGLDMDEVDHQKVHAAINKYSLYITIFT